MLRESEGNRIELLGTLDMLIRAGSNEVLQVENRLALPAAEQSRWTQLVEAMAALVLSRGSEVRA
jgi:hypothetical protein